MGNHQLFCFFSTAVPFQGAWGAEHPQITICGRVKGRLRQQAVVSADVQRYASTMRRIASRAHLGVRVRELTAASGGCREADEGKTTSRQEGIYTVAVCDDCFLGP